MKITESMFGTTPDGDPVHAYTMTSHRNASVTVITYGATLVSALMPDRNGVPSEITLGFDTLAGYLGPHPYFGATIGRYANRIQNAEFTLDGERYQLAANDGNHHLHGGTVGFDRRVWHASPDCGPGTATVMFSRVSPDGEEGYPGALDVRAGYRFTDAHELYLEYYAATDAPTVLNLTNHTYWNLSAPGTPVLDHRLSLNCSRYLPVDEDLIALGTIADVADTPLDFRDTKPIGRDIQEAGGYDHCFIVDGRPGRMRQAAAAHAPDTGRTMTVYTDRPAVQLYTASMLEDTVGKAGVTYSKYGAFCLETGAYDDAVQHPQFPTSVVRPGELFHTTTRIAFDCAV